MHYNVPQFIDIEDKIVGPLTAKQLLWIFGMAGVLLIMWFNIQDKVVFVVVGLPVALLFIALAFYRPNGQSLIKFIMHAALFVVRPKIYMWRRGDIQNKVVKDKVIIEKEPEKKSIKQEELIDLAKILDSESEILRK